MLNQSPHGMMKKSGTAPGVMAIAVDYKDVPIYAVVCPSDFFIIPYGQGSSYR